MSRRSQIYPNIKNGVILYIILTVLFLTLGALTQSINVFFGIVVTEVVLLGLFSIFWAKYHHNNLTLTFGFSKAKRGTIGRSILIMLVLYPIAAMINGVFLSFVTKFLPMPESASGVPLPENFGMLLISIITFAILPGIFEELVFRGYLFRAFDKFKISSRILITALLFAIFHYNPYNFIGPFVLGIVLGIIRYKSNSIYPSMVAHATNNSIAMILGYLIKDLPDTTLGTESELEIMENISGIQIAFAIVVITLMIIWVYRLVKNFPDYSERVCSVESITKSDKIYTLISVLWGICIFVIMAILLYKAV